MISSPTQAVLALLGSERCSTVFVDGPVGSGKTAALRAVATAVREQGRRVLAAHAHEMSRRAPLGLVGDLLAVDRQTPPAADLSGRMLAAADRWCAAGPVVLLADDVHLADADSLTVLWRLHGMATDLPLQLVLARRRLPAREMLTALARQPRVETVPLAAPEPGEQPGAAAVARYRLLDPQARQLLDLAAVWTAPIAPRTIAALRDKPLAGLTEVIAECVASGALTWSDGDLLEFARSADRQAWYAELDPPLRRLMHESFADFLRGTAGPVDAIAYHLERSGHPPADSGSGNADDVTLARSLRALTQDFTDAPGVAAEILGAAVGLAATDRPLAGRIACQQALTLVKAGRLSDAAAVASAALPTATDPATAAELLRVLTLTFSARARVADVDRIVAMAAQRPDLPTASGRRLRTVAEWMHVASGRTGAAPVVATPAAEQVAAGAGALPLVIVAARMMMAGSGIEAIRAAEAAAEGFHRLAGYDRSESSSVNVWPTQFRLFTFGPDDAGRYAHQWRSRTAAADDRWVDPFHQFVSAAIATTAGRWDDAAAEFDAALEEAQLRELGWTSLAVGLRSRIDLARGSDGPVPQRIAAFRRRGEPQLLGLKEVDLAEARMALKAAPGAAPMAMRAVVDGWESANVLWRLMSGPSVYRLADAIGDHELRARVHADLTELGTVALPALTPGIAVVDALYRGRLDLAVSAADSSAAVGDLTAHAYALADAAVIAARTAPDRVAGELATRADQALAGLGAAADRHELAARLRSLGVRPGVRGRRRRPSHGWESLTDTESDIVARIAQGQAGPQIAAALWVSPRTVQTHVSHALHKLGLRNRIELAAAHAARHGTTATEPEGPISVS